jgi:hypothetical protein
MGLQLLGLRIWRVRSVPTTRQGRSIGEHLGEQPAYAWPYAWPYGVAVQLFDVGDV